MLTEIQEYMKHVKALPADLLLGHLAMFTVNDGRYRVSDLETWFEALGLDKQYLPGADTPVNAFKKATSKANETEYDLPDGNTATVLVRDLSSDRQRIVRALVREVRDVNRRRLSHATVGHATFYRASVRTGTTVLGSERMVVSLTSGELRDGEYPLTRTVADQISADYDRLCGSMDGMKIRAMIRDYLRLALSAVNIKGKGGVYFVGMGKASGLEALQELVKRLGNGCELYRIPLADLEDQRAMVIQAWEEEATKGLNALVAEIVELRKTRRQITSSTYARVLSEYKRIQAQTTEYTSALNLQQDRTASAADMALAALRALQRSMIADI